MKPSRTLRAVEYTAAFGLALALIFLGLAWVKAIPEAFAAYGTFAAVAVGAMGAATSALAGRHWGAKEGSSATLPVVDGEPPVREP